MKHVHANPNHYRLSLPLLAVAALIGNAACSAAKDPSPVRPIPTVEMPATDMPTPSCAVKAAVDGRTATLSLGLEDADLPGNYTPDYAIYDYGDGTSEDHGNYHAQTHAYARAGQYTVSATLVIDVAPQGKRPGGLDYTEAVSCTSTNVSAT